MLFSGNWGHLALSREAGAVHVLNALTRTGGFERRDVATLLTFNAIVDTLSRRSFGDPIELAEMASGARNAAWRITMETLEIR
jgi:hypothetical protein